jgi:radical SAM family RiPP maturation amino acid epimerase
MNLKSYHDRMLKYADVKRFFERWTADPDFKSDLRADTQGTLARYNLKINPADIESLLQEEESSEKAFQSPALQAMWQIAQSKTAWLSAFYQKESLPVDRRMLLWRERQIARQLLDLGPFHAYSNIHSSLTIELTQGCSVGCWFCALSPDSLKGVFVYDEENAAMWHKALCVLRDKLGDGAKSGFLYWATDPLDNPDYEKFCLDFHNVIGVFPPTTTALCLKDPARTRALLKMAEVRDCWLNRFSVLSIGLMGRVHEEFSSEELALVECVPLNKQANLAYGNAGRFRERALKDPTLLETQRRKLKHAPWYESDPQYKDSEDYPHSSIGCVTGFLINMCARNVQLISPCTADDRWPLGYIIFGSSHFSSAEELSDVLERLMRDCMKIEIEPDYRISFYRWLKYEPLADGFNVRGRFNQHLAFRDDSSASFYSLLGRLINDGSMKASQIAQQVQEHLGCDPQLTFNALNELHRKGILDEYVYEHA